VELSAVKLTSAREPLDVQLLGSLTIRRAGQALALPTSRKVRALIAYLALAPRPATRTHLCELLGDLSSDPRGELRWCLSKVRGLLDEPGLPRLRATGELLELDLQDCVVDAIDVARATQDGVGSLPVERLRELCALCVGEFLGSLELDRSPQFNAWLIAQRRRFRACHVAMLEQLVRGVPEEDPAEVLSVLERWLELAPLDRRAHEILLDRLARHGRMREGAEHLAATARLFESEGLDFQPLRDAWHAATSRHRSVSVRQPGVSQPPQPDTPVALATRRASIAVMPLLEQALSASDATGRVGAALIHDVITRLAKLRSVAVIAQGTVFALGERGIGPEAAGRMLNVDYVASGSLRSEGNRITVMMELAETRMARIVWADDFEFPLDDALRVLDDLGNRIVAAIAGEIETAERNRAFLKAPSSLDAWEAYHRGLWHMYRFSASDNEQAHRFFRMAVQLDPTFSRAHAGLSFTHFQNAFLHRVHERDQETERALAAAAQGLIADERDPAAHWAMGRALWLRGEQEQCLLELGRAVELSPNFALGHYTLAFVHSQSGDPRSAIVSADQSRQLSPFDPLLFGMLASRAIAHLRLGEFEEAANWAVQAAGRPNAHVHIRAIAAHSLAAAARVDEARALVTTIHRTHPSYGILDYLTAFRFSEDAVALFRTNASQIGMG
jgi:DNA-binding SARP family transcriptional activator/tetratricopeptide (TPR) repeat protein